VMSTKNTQPIDGFVFFVRFVKTRYFLTSGG
jgi:hypothetical protein